MRYDALSSPIKQFLQRFRQIRLPRLRWMITAIAVCFGVVLYGVIVLSQQPVHLTFMMQALEGTQWASIVEAFEAENPDIKIDLVEGPNATNLVEDLYTSSFLLGDSPYDLVYMDIVWVPKFAAAGWLMDLSDRVANTDMEDFLSADVEGGSYEGSLYRMPFRSDGGMLYYREDLLNEAGLQPPETFEELVAASNTLQESGAVNWGYVWQGRQYEGLAAMFVEVLEGFGGFWINPDTMEVGLDEPQAIQAIEFLHDTIADGISPSGVTTYQEEEARRLFQSGGAAFMRNWPYVWPLANSDDSPVQGQIAIKPMVHAPNRTSGACQGGWGLGIATSTPHPEEAWRAVEFFSRPDILRQFILETGYVPSRRSLFTDPEIVAKYSHYPALLEVVENAVLRPPIPQYAQASDILQRYLSAALTDRTSPERAMQNAAAETRRLLGRFSAS